MSGTMHVGNKSKVADHADRYLSVHWFPRFYGQVFLQLWNSYLRCRAVLKTDHPYAFVSFTSRDLGNPYTINAFGSNYTTGLKRIGLKRCKAMGFGPHGHRHSYGRRLVEGGADALVIRKCLHHSSLESQVPYTTPSFKVISDALQAASVQLSQSQTEPPAEDWEDYLRYGFEDIDPFGYFSGKNAILNRKSDK